MICYFCIPTVFIQAALFCSSEFAVHILGSSAKSVTIGQLGLI